MPTMNPASRVPGFVFWMLIIVVRGLIEPAYAIEQEYDIFGEPIRGPTSQETIACRIHLSNGGIKNRTVNDLCTGGFAICAAAHSAAKLGPMDTLAPCSDFRIQILARQDSGYGNCLDFLHSYFDGPETTKICSRGASSSIAGHIDQGSFAQCVSVLNDNGYGLKSAAYECISTPTLVHSALDTKKVTACLQGLASLKRSYLDEHQRAHYCATFPEIGSSDGMRCLTKLLNLISDDHSAIITCSNEVFVKVTQSPGFGSCENARVEKFYRHGSNAYMSRIQFGPTRPFFLNGVKATSYLSSNYQREENLRIQCKDPQWLRRCAANSKLRVGCLRRRINASITVISTVVSKRVNSYYGTSSQTESRRSAMKTKWIGILWIGLIGISAMAEETMRRPRRYKYDTKPTKW